MTERRKLTPIEISWMNNLKAIWKEKKVELGLTQETLAQVMEWKSQASVASYLNGRLPLNTDAKLKFAKALRVDVARIDPDFPIKGEKLPADSEEFLGQYMEGFKNIGHSEQLKLAQRVISLSVELQKLKDEAQ